MLVSSRPLFLVSCFQGTETIYIITISRHIHNNIKKKSCVRVVKLETVIVDTAKYTAIIFSVCVHRELFLPSSRVGVCDTVVC
jgi:hypothetical protein